MNRPIVPMAADVLEGVAFALGEIVAGDGVGIGEKLAAMEFRVIPFSARDAC